MFVEDSNGINFKMRCRQVINKLNRDAINIQFICICNLFAIDEWFNRETPLFAIQLVMNTISLCVQICALWFKTAKIYCKQNDVRCSLPKSPKSSENLPNHNIKKKLKKAFNRMFGFEFLWKSFIYAIDGVSIIWTYDLSITVAIKR